MLERLDSPQEALRPAMRQDGQERRSEISARKLLENLVATPRATSLPDPLSRLF